MDPPLNLVEIFLNWYKSAQSTPPPPSFQDKYHWEEIFFLAFYLVRVSMFLASVTWWFGSSVGFCRCIPSSQNCSSKAIPETQNIILHKLWEYVHRLVQARQWTSSNINDENVFTKHGTSYYINKCVHWLV